ncbi:MAG: GNAT family N-acetyltransferase [Armatimonadetes bacterium]|nr:GNAT family N-acetyltransferase [Armatimonadota bacterium]
MDVVLERGLEPFEALRPEWDALAARCAALHPFMLHAWLRASLHHLGGADELLVVAFRDEGRLVGLAPLRMERSLALRRLTFAFRHVDYADFLVEAGREWDVLSAFFRWVRENLAGWNLLRLRQIPSRSPNDALVPVLAEMEGLAVRGWRLDPCPYIQLPATLEEFLAEMPARRWQKDHGARRLRKLAREHGEPRLEALAGAEVTGDEIERFLDLHARSWEARGGSAALGGDGLRRFHATVAEALASTGVCRLFWLTVGARRVAGSYGFLMGDTFFGYMLAQDPEFAAYSVGRQVLLKVIEHGVGQGWREIDMLVGGERYKLDYTRRFRHTTEYDIARSRRWLDLMRALSALRGRPRS